jgi:hypothetical protein
MSEIDKILTKINIIYKSIEIYKNSISKIKDKDLIFQFKLNIEKENEKLLILKGKYPELFI